MMLGFDCNFQSTILSWDKIELDNYFIDKENNNNYHVFT